MRQREVARRIYRISKDGDGIFLLCQDFSHVERIDSFNESPGSRRSQAARAMQNHSREKLSVGSALKPIPQNYGLMKQWWQGSGIRCSCQLDSLDRIQVGLIVSGATPLEGPCFHPITVGSLRKGQQRPFCSSSDRD
jgi:hypothetical protein